MAIYPTPAPNSKTRSPVIIWWFTATVSCPSYRSPWIDLRIVSFIKWSGRCRVKPFIRNLAKPALLCVVCDVATCLAVSLYWCSKIQSERCACAYLLVLEILVRNSHTIVITSGLWRWIVSSQITDLPRGERNFRAKSARGGWGAKR